MSDDNAEEMRPGGDDAVQERRERGGKSLGNHCYIALKARVVSDQTKTARAEELRTDLYRIKISSCRTLEDNIRENELTLELYTIEKTSAKKIQTKRLLLIRLKKELAQKALDDSTGLERKRRADMRSSDAPQDVQKKRRRTRDHRPTPTAIADDRLGVAAENVADEEPDIDELYFPETCSLFDDGIVLYDAEEETAAEETAKEETAAEAAAEEGEEQQPSSSPPPPPEVSGL